MKKFVIAFAIAATTTMAFAGSPGKQGRWEDRSAHMQKFEEKLGLSEAQKQQVAEIRRADQEKNQQLYSDARAKRQEYRQLKEANDPRASEVKAQLKAMKEQLKAAHQATHEQILQVLTPEQRTQLEQWRSSKRKNRDRD